MTIRVVLVDDHKIIRDGLRSMLESEAVAEVIGEASNGRDGVRLARELKPDVVVMDVGMPDLNGIEATRQIQIEAPGVKTLALSMHADKRFVAGMLKAGASGYLLKDCAFEELTTAIRCVADNRVYTSPAVTQVVVEDYVRHLTDEDPVAESPLTGREREVLQLLAEGNRAKEIASNLHISLRTVETHRRHIMEKLDMHTVAELTKYAVREGFTSLGS